MELRQLHANALALNEGEVASMCDEILTKRPRGHPAKPRKARAKVPA